MEEPIAPVRRIAAAVGVHGRRWGAATAAAAGVLVAVSALARQLVGGGVAEDREFVVAAAEYVQFNCRAATALWCLIVTNLKAEEAERVGGGAREVDEKLAAMGWKVDHGGGRVTGRALVGLVIFKLMIQQIPFLARGFSWHIADYLDYTVYNFPMLITHILLAHWIFHLSILRLHFETLTGLLKSVRSGECWTAGDLFNRNKSKVATARREVLRTCAVLYDTLCKRSRDINEVFAWQILGIIPTLFVLITFNSFQTCRMIKRSIRFDCGWIVFDVLCLVNLVELVGPCVVVGGFADEFADVVRQVEVNDVVEDMVTALILQTHHQKVKFTAREVFPLNGTLIYSILGAVTTYLVILLQFDL